MKRSRILWSAIGLFCLGAIVLSIPVSSKVREQKMGTAKSIQRADFSSFSSKPPEQPLDVLFIHHSCGGQLLASAGPSVGEQCIFASHPNGGGLRARLQQSGYHLHEASYGSRIGEKTDVFDWLPKFQNQMDEILRCDMQDVSYTDARRNQVVIFKSCFPNNAFRGEGAPPGSPAGPELTLWNAKAAYSALLVEFRKHPEVLFVCLTAPPLAPGRSSQPLWRQIARTAKGMIKTAPYDLAESGPLAREFNTWLCDADGWLKDYGLNNVVVFDYYDILTDHGESNFSRYPTWDGADSHPSRDGNEKVAEAFVPFLNQAIRRAALQPAIAASE